MKTIYLRTNLANGKQYVGQTKDLKRRERDWRKLKTNYSNKELNEDRIKYGLENWKVEVLEIVDDSISDEAERNYIEKYNTMSPYGYNQYNGGIKGFTFQMKEEEKKKISETLKGVPKNHSVEGKKRIAEATRDRLSMPIEQIDDTTEKVIKTWNSARQAARELGFSQCNISQCCNGKRKTANGYGWRYKQNI